MQADAIPLVLVAAVARNGVIGRDGGLPWRIPGDLKRFKALTMGHPVLMGRRTFESIGKPLPGRANFVVSRRADFAPQGVEVLGSIDDGAAAARARAAADGADAVMVIGGGELYSVLLPRAGRLELTEIDQDLAGDTWFPALDRSAWREIGREPGTTGPDVPAHAFVTLIPRESVARA